VRQVRGDSRGSPELDRNADSAAEARERLMPRWRADFIGKKGSHLGTVEAADEKSAIATAAKDAVKSLHSCSDHCGDADAKSGSTYYRFGHDW
jgi:hypothetical protein